MTQYAVELEYGNGGDTTIEAANMEEAERLAEAWAREGDYGDGGCSAHINIQSLGGEDEATEMDIDIPSVEPPCLEDGQDHLLYTDDECGGVRSRGGTVLITTQYCLRCGRARTEINPGSQRNPGDAPRVEWEDEPIDSQYLARLRGSYGYVAL
jgi:hypothetical protein